MSAVLVITAVSFVMFFCIATTLYSLTTNMKTSDVYKSSVGLALGLTAVVFIGVSAMFLIDYNEVFRAMASWGF